MSVLMVPALDPEPFPTLGPELCDFIEERLVYGPGVLKGEPYVIAPWVRGLLYRAYEVYPKGHPLAGRRRFKLVSWSLKKGSAKTELGAIITVAEAHPEAPVRCDGFDADGNPVGIAVTQPFIPMFAFNLEQSEELGYSVVREIIEDSGSDVSRFFDVGLERILVMSGDGKVSGKIVPVGNSPAARDGARTTFALVDETHHLTLPRMKKAINISRQNLFKRAGIYGSGWQLETTTAYSPGEQSVAEETHDYAKLIDSGKVEDPSLFYFHRQASDDMPMDTPEQVKAALLEAAGPTADWSSDIDGLVSHYFEPNTDRNWFRRVWLNQPMFGSGRAFDVTEWDALADPSIIVPDGALIVAGFDGSRRKDATALYAFDVEQSHGWLVGMWERPVDADDDWEVPSHEVDGALRMLFDRYDVFRINADPPYWQDKVDEWAGDFGDKRVVSWWTNRTRPMANAIRMFNDAIKSGSFTHDGDSRMHAHVANAVRQALTITDEEDRPLWTVRKERRDSPLKIDGVLAATLALDAFGACMAKGKPRGKRKSKLHSF